MATHNFDAFGYRVGVGPHGRAQRWGLMTRRWSGRDDERRYSLRSPVSSGAEAEVALCAPLSARSSTCIPPRPCLDNDDPTGHFTSLNGLSAQAQITRIYIADHPGDKIVAGGVWSWLSNLKPDIEDYTTHEWLEVKPLTPTGVSDAVDAIFKYAPAAIFGWFPDHLWSPSTKTIWVNGQPEAIFNAGGIVFYGDQVELTAETVLGISLLTARTVAEYLPRIYELVGAGQRAIQLALGPGPESDLGIATLNGELVAI